MFAFSCLKPSKLNKSCSVSWYNLEVVKPTVCPYCGSTLIEEGANLFCPNQNCTPRVVARLTNFACKNGVNIEGFSERTAEDLYLKLGVDNFSKLYQLTEQDLLSLEGFKKLKANNLLTAIINSKSVDFANFIYALGIDNVGKKTAKDFADKFENLDQLIKSTKEELLSIEEVGEIIADDVVAYFNNQDNLQEIQSLLSLGVKINYPLKVKEGVFVGEKVVLTGSLTDFTRDQAGKIIESLGGELSSSVTKTTTLVLAGENAGSKLEKAKSLGIKIIDEQEFKLLINNY